MKKTLSIAGAVLFTLGFAMATGVDQNPIQAVYAVVCMGGACVCFNRVETIGKEQEQSANKAKSIPAPGRMEKAA